MLMLQKKKRKKKEEVCWEYNSADTGLPLRVAAQQEGTEAHSASLHCLVH